MVTYGAGRIGVGEVDFRSGGLPFACVCYDAEACGLRPDGVDFEVHPIRRLVLSGAEPQKICQEGRLLAKIGGTGDEVVRYLPHAFPILVETVEGTRLQRSLGYGQHVSM